MILGFGFSERKFKMVSALKKDLKYYIDLGKEWKTSSCVSRNYPPSFSHSDRKTHGGIKPPELMYELIKAYGSYSNNILDPFAGVGSTLIASSLLRKKATGIEINEAWKDVYYKVCLDNKVKTQNWITGDSQQILKQYKTH